MNPKIKINFHRPPKHPDHKRLTPSWDIEITAEVILDHITPYPNKLMRLLEEIDSSLKDQFIDEYGEAK